MAAAMLEVDGETKKWTLRKKRILGKGSFGMATLYEDTATGELVVVKDLNLQCIKKAADVEAVHNEIQILKKTSTHPNIVHYLDSSFDGKFSMQILMEYCDGGDLAEFIEVAERANKPLPESQILSFAVQILMGLHHLHHDHRILHRDLKPQNIFLTAAGVAKIGDFGVSTVLSQNVDFAKTFCGSPYYLAPEMCEEKRYNGKADLWSTGVMLYEMMALRRPFDGKNLVSLVTQITRADYPLIADALDYTMALRDMTYSLLQLDPDTRPTLKRLLRSSLVLSAHKHIPSYCTRDAFYVNHFGRLAASPARTQRGRGVGHSTSSKEAQMLAEMEAWAAMDKDQLLSAETGMGLKRSELVDTALLDATQVKMMSSAGRSAHETVQPLVLTASADDDSWNEHYDDDFEDDDDDVVVEPSLIPMAQRSFRFSQ